MLFLERAPAFRLVVMGPALLNVDHVPQLVALRAKVAPIGRVRRPDLDGPSIAPGGTEPPGIVVSGPKKPNNHQKPDSSTISQGTSRGSVSSRIISASFPCPLIVFPSNRKGSASLIVTTKLLLRSLGSARFAGNFKIGGRSEIWISRTAEMSSQAKTREVVFCKTQMPFSPTNN